MIRRLSSYRLGPIALLCFPATLAACQDAGTPDRREPTHYGSIDPFQLANQLDKVLREPAMTTAAYWRSKPSLAATFAYPREPTLSTAERTNIGRLKSGRFSPHKLFEWQPLGVPPSWSDNPADSRTYDFYRHSLIWMEPLVDASIVENDVESRTLLKRVIEDWVRINSRPPGATRYAWNDHAASYRLRLFSWLWELHRRDEHFDIEFSRLLLASVYQHIQYALDEKNYHPTSNHALHLDGSLLAACLTFAEFRDSDRWRSKVLERIDQWLTRNFSPEGFHLEQSPSYHWYVLERLGEIVYFLRQNGHPVPKPILDLAARSAMAWRFLIRPDGLLPNIGDTGGVAPKRWPARFRTLFGLTPNARSSDGYLKSSAPHGDFVLSFDAGYAIFTSYSVLNRDPPTDTYALFRCNSWRHSGHCHNDALSFELYGLGREWLVDSGKFNYEYDSRERKYFVSARAHNVVLVDNVDFPFAPVKLVDAGRDGDRSHVTARHELKRAHHTRRFEFVPPYALRLTDTIEAVDAKPHTYTQLLHVAPGLQVEIVSPREVRLTSEQGDRCVIQQDGDLGEWSIIDGQRDPFIQGWYSRKFNEKVPIPTLYYTTPEPVVEWELKTRITLRPTDPPPSGRE